MFAQVTGISADDLALCLISGGGLGAAGAARPRPHAGRQASHEPRAAEKRRQHPRGELRAHAPRGEQTANRRLASTDFLARNDGYSFFAALDRLIVTGPGRTNVNDFRAIYLPL